MLKPRAIRATAMPIRPRPITPSTLLLSWLPMYFLRSQAPDLRLLQACTTLRLMASIKAIVCSAALSVLPPGVFITRMPLRVAAGTSMLSMPTPARATPLSRPGLDRTLASPSYRCGRSARHSRDDVRQLILTDPELHDCLGAGGGVDQIDPSCASLSVMSTLIIPVLHKSPVPLRQLRSVSPALGPA
jgi:hypothetical protein